MSMMMSQILKLRDSTKYFFLPKKQFFNDTLRAMIWQKKGLLTEVTFNKSNPPFVELFLRCTTVTKRNLLCIE